jgi:glycosyltransferase involved in cell wall biosynthesis
MERIVVVAHKYLAQPDDDLVAYLNAQRKHKVLHIYHSFPDAADRCSFYRLYENGEETSHGQTRDYRKWPDPLIYLKELLFTVAWTVRMGRAWDRYVGMDGLCVFFGNLMRAAGRVKRTIFWAIDFVPEKRFKSGIKNLVYAGINKHGCLHADEVWDLSPRMADARARFAGIRLSEYRAHKVVPYGLWLERLQRYSYQDCDRRTVVFMGHLLEKQGVQLAVAAMRNVLERVPDAKLKIIGDGSYRPALERLAAEMGIAEHCRFVGKIASSEELENEIARSAVAIAPYMRALDTWTVYADPGKVKTYLACGVPVLLTDVPWNAAEIQSRGCGVVISEDIEDIAEAIIRLMSRETNQEMRDKALAYAQGFGWQKIFQDALEMG